MGGSETERRDALVDRLFGATIGTLEMFSVYLGLRLGLYEALHEGEATPADLAGRAGIHERYAREWLEQQAVAGFLEVVDEDQEASRRRFRLPSAHAAVLAAPEDPAYVAPFAQLLAGIGDVLPELIEAYRTGGGVAYARYGDDLRHGQAAINRPAFLHDLADVWIPRMEDVHERLRADPPARVCDVGCGEGWSTMALARGYPKARVIGIDLDQASITDARRHAAEVGMEGRVTFEVRDAADARLEGRFDLVCVFEALHDMARPLEALAAMRGMLAEGGSVFVVDERVADRFTAPGDEVERIMYGWSILHCLPAGMVEQPSAATGTVMRTDTLRRYATEAGFTRVEVVPVEHEFFRFYRLRP